jgi:hypothetical protein
MFFFGGDSRIPTSDLCPALFLVDLIANRWNEILRELSEWNQLKIAHEALLATR